MGKRRSFHFNIKRARRPISLKLGLLTSSLTFILIFFFTLFIVNISKNKVMEQLKDKGLSTLLSLSESSKSAVIENNYMFLAGLPQTIAHEKDILYLILVDNNGRCLMHTNEKFLDAQLKDKISLRALSSSKVEKPFIQEYYHKNHGYKVYDISKGIGIGNRKWATLRLGISTKRLNLIAKRMYQKSFLGSIVVALLAFVITFFLSRTTVRPLFVLKKRLDDLSEKGEVKKVSIRTGDEAEELAQSFNYMLDGWRKMHEQLKESKLDLEKKVEEEKERTAKLEKAYWELQTSQDASLNIMEDLEKTQDASLNIMGDLERRRKELDDAKAYVDNIIRSTIDTLIVIDPDGKIKDVNQATLDIVGYDEKELIGQPAGVLFAEEEEEEEEALFKGTRLQKLIEEGSVRNYDMTYRTKSGEKIPVSFSGSVMYETRGQKSEVRGQKSEDRGDTKYGRQIVGIVGIARDMREIKRLMQKEREIAAAAAAAETDRKRAAEIEKAYRELRETQAALVQSEKLAAVGRLAAGVAHEINNPLASILLGAQRASSMIKKQVKSIPDSKVYLRNLERMEESTNRCKKIVAGLLAFSRPTKIELGPTDINKAIEETLESLEEQVKAQDVKVIKGFAPSLPIIEADGQQLSQVFSNLIVNACESMSKGGQLRIITRLQTPEAGVQSDAWGEIGETVEIEFSDTGKGISEEDMLRMFDPFFTTKEVGKGVGLGLSISYAIVKQHGGTIGVRSKKRSGTTFIVRLPVKNLEEEVTDGNRGKMGC